MADLNKVIESLEFCAVGAECDHCKYAQENKGDYEGCHHLMADAAELLRAYKAVDEWQKSQAIQYGDMQTV